MLFSCSITFDKYLSCQFSFFVSMWGMHYVHEKPLLPNKINKTVNWYHLMFKLRVSTNKKRNLQGEIWSTQIQDLYWSKLRIAWSLFHPTPPLDQMNFNKFREFSESWQNLKIVWLPVILPTWQHTTLPVIVIKSTSPLIPVGISCHWLHWISTQISN